MHLSIYELHWNGTDFIIIIYCLHVLWKRLVFESKITWCNLYILHMSTWFYCLKFSKCFRKKSCQLVHFSCTWSGDVHACYFPSIFVLFIWKITKICISVMRSIIHSSEGYYSWSSMVLSTCNVLDNTIIPKLILNMFWRTQCWWRNIDIAVTWNFNDIKINEILIIYWNEVSESWMTITYLYYSENGWIMDNKNILVFSYNYMLSILSRNFWH